MKEVTYNNVKYDIVGFIDEEQTKAILRNKEDRSRVIVDVAELNAPAPSHHVPSHHAHTSVSKDAPTSKE